MANPFNKSPVDLVIDKMGSGEVPGAVPAPKVERVDVKTPRQSETSDQRMASLMPIFEKAAVDNNVPLNVIVALGWQESDFNTRAVGQPTKWGTAKGIMQYLDGTAKGLGIDPMDPSQAINAAAKQLRERLDKGYSMEDAVKEHFAGPNRSMWGPKTDVYGKQVLERANVIASRLGAEPPKLDFSKTAPTPLKPEDQNAWADARGLPKPFAEPEHPAIQPPRQSQQQEFNQLPITKEINLTKADGSPMSQSVMKPYEPTIWDKILDLIGPNRDAAAVELAARRIAEREGKDVREVYNEAGGHRSVFNPEGRAPIRAAAEAGKVVYDQKGDILPGAANAALRAVRGGDTSADDTLLDKAISATDVKPQGYQDPNYSSFHGIGQSLGYSAATMVPALAAGAAGTAAGGPVGGGAAAMGASGAVAYRASKDQFLSDVVSKAEKEAGRRLTQPELDKVVGDADEAATMYGAWEAIPEAISNVIMMRAVVAPLKGATRAAKVADLSRRFATEQASEQGTETATTWGQNKAELMAGLTNYDMPLAEAFRQQAIPTLFSTAAMGGAGHAARAAYDATRSKQEKIGRALNEQVDATQLQADPAAAVQAFDPNNAQSVQPVPSGPLGRAMQNAPIPAVAQTAPAPEQIPQQPAEQAPQQETLAPQESITTKQEAAAQPQRVKLTIAGEDTAATVLEQIPEGLMVQDDNGDKYLLPAEAIQSGEIAIAPLEQPAQPNQAAAPEVQPAEQAPARAEPKPYEQMTAGELNQRLAYIKDQGKTNGWNGTLAQEKAKVEDAIATLRERELSQREDEDIQGDEPQTWGGLRTLFDREFRQPEVNDDVEQVREPENGSALVPENTTQDGKTRPADLQASREVAQVREAGAGRIPDDAGMVVADNGASVSATAQPADAKPALTGAAKGDSVIDEIEREDNQFAYRSVQKAIDDGVITIGQANDLISRATEVAKAHRDRSLAGEYIEEFITRARGEPFNYASTISDVELGKAVARGEKFTEFSPSFISGRVGKPVLSASSSAEIKSPIPAPEAKPALAEIPQVLGADGKPKWFGSKPKAAEFIAKKGLSDTHEVKKVGQKWEIHPKEQQAKSKQQADVADRPATSVSGETVTAPAQAEASPIEQPSSEAGQLPEDQQAETVETQSPVASSIPRATDYPDAKSYRQAMLEYYNQNPRSERPVNTIAENVSKLDRKIENAEKRLQERLRKQAKPGLTPPAIIQNAIDNIRDEIKSLRAERKSIVGSIADNQNKSASTKRAYHGSLTKGITSLSESKGADTSFYGKGVYLTSDKEDAGDYASTDAARNRDLTGRAEAMAKQLGVTYNEAKDALTKDGGALYDVDYDHKRPFVVDQDNVSFKNTQALRLALSELDVPKDRHEGIIKRIKAAENNGTKMLDVLSSIPGKGRLLRQYASITNHDALVLKGPFALRSERYKDRPVEHVLLLDESLAKIAGSTDVPRAEGTIAFDGMQAAKKDTASEPTKPLTEEELIDRSLLKEHAGRWKYRSSLQSGWFTANTKEGAVERAQEAYRKAIANGEEVLTKDQRYQRSSDEFYSEMDRRYGRLSMEELAAKMKKLGGDISSLQSAGRREMNGNGGRRTGAAVAAEGARQTAEERMRLGTYMDMRKEHEGAGNAQVDNPGTSKPTTRKDIINAAVERMGNVSGLDAQTIASKAQKFFNTMQATETLTAFPEYKNRKNDADAYRRLMSDFKSITEQDLIDAANADTGYTVEARQEAEPKKSPQQIRKEKAQRRIQQAIESIDGAEKGRKIKITGSIGYASDGIYTVENIDSSGNVFLKGERGSTSISHAEIMAGKRRGATIQKVIEGSAPGNPDASGMIASGIKEKTDAHNDAVKKAGTGNKSLDELIATFGGETAPSRAMVNASLPAQKEIYEAIKDADGLDEAYRFSKLLDSNYSSDWKKAIEIAKGVIQGDTQSNGANKETKNEPNTARTVEQDGAIPENAMGNGTGEGEGLQQLRESERAVGEKLAAGRTRPTDGSGVPAASPVDAGTPGDNVISGKDRESGSEIGTAGASDARGNRRGSREGVQSDDKADTRLRAKAQKRDRELTGRAKQQAEADKVAVIVGDEANVRATLPLLSRPQQDDVIRAERRLFTDGGKGKMLTNGTGTGKTYSGLGVAKRVIQRGGSVLVVSPAGVNPAWEKGAKDLLMTPHRLKDKRDAGKDGLNVTSFQNFRDNQELMKRHFDLVIYDESHHLMANMDGESTSANVAHKALTGHPSYEITRGTLAIADEFDEYKRAAEDEIKKLVGQTGIEQEQASRTVYSSPKFDNWYKRLNDKARKIANEMAAMQKDNPTKVLFLSASPFAGHKSVFYADGYLFDSREGAKESGAYNTGSPEAQYLVSNFGYRMRYNRVTMPGPEVDVSLLERDWADQMFRSGAMTGRKIDLDKDYSREFVVVEPGVGSAIDEAFKAIDWKTYPNLSRQIIEWRKGGSDRQLAEALRGRGVVERIQKHLDMGRKVVVFHERQTLSLTNPFNFKAPTPEAQAEIAALKAAHPEIFKIDLSGLKPVPDVIAQHFGDKVAYFSGLNKSTRDKELADFNDDNGKAKILVIQKDAGKEGLSAHDITGNHQRALIITNTPVSPADAIQMEGRTYRHGLMSDAVIEYPTIQTSFEKSAYRDTVSTRTSTAENLAMGSQARNLREAFREGYLEPSMEAPSDKQGKGGKLADSSSDGLTMFDRAKTYYYRRQKKTSKNKAAEGEDYFATPEPVGLKMVEFADLQPGDRALEPSAGHGAIARWLPEYTDNLAIEQSPELVGELGIVTTGDVRHMDFEDLNQINKYHAIVMNPPFGRGGAKAVEHIEKAAGHLKDGGRIVAIYPKGPAADAKFDKWFGEAQGLHLIASIDLPSVTFGRAGTSVATRMLVIDRDNRGNNAYQSTIKRDLSGIEDINELFDRLRDMELPKRPDIRVTAKEVNINESEVKKGEQTIYRATLTEFIRSGAAHSLGKKELKKLAEKFGGEVGKSDRSYWNETNYDFDREKDRERFYAAILDAREKMKATDGRYSIADTIEVDGKQRPATNSNGQPIHATEEGIRNFWRWFGDSKVVDGQGRPLVVYHGSPDIRGIIEGGFKPSITRGGVFFFSDSQSVANTYADPKRAMDYQNAEDHVIPVYLSIVNPEFVDAEGRKWRDTERYVAQAKRDGKDGIIIKNSRDEYNNTGNGGKLSTVLATFNPEQIKSASAPGILRSRFDGRPISDISNTGKFSPESADIRYSMGASAGDLMTDPLIKSLVDSGKIVIHDTTDTLPSQRKNGVAGFTAADGTIHVVGNNLSVVLHEAFHSDGEALLGDKRWQNLITRLESMHKAAKAGDGFWKGAADRVARAGVTGKLAAEEFGAYAIENYQRAPAGVRKWVESMAGAVQAWLYRRFGIQAGKVSAAQLRSLAKAALRSMNESSPVGPNGGSRMVEAYSQSANEKSKVESLASRLVTKAMPAMLQAVSLDRMIEELGNGMPSLKAYLRDKRQMDAYRNTLHAKHDAIANDWLKFNMLHPAMGKLLASIMHKSTIEQVDQTMPFNETVTNADRYEAEVNPDSPEGKAAAERIAEDERRFAAWKELKDDYNKLPEKGRELYRTVRDAYRVQIEELDKILIDNLSKALDLQAQRAERKYNEEVQRIYDEGMAGEERDEALKKAERKFIAASTKHKYNKAARILELRRRFEGNRLSGPYFPLSRFGNYFVTGRDQEGKVIEFSKFENPTDQQRFAVELEKEGLDVQQGYLYDSDRLKQAIDSGFVADIDEILSSAEVSDAIKDQIWQRYIDSMPEMSMRKKFKHRKNREGYNKDALRAFASQMFHGAHQMARLKYGAQMTEHIEQAKHQTKEQKDPVRAAQVVNEVEQKHQFVMNPTGSQWVQNLSALGFIYHLTSPASALVNFAQTYMLGVPILGAKFGRFGMARAGFELTRALKDFTAGMGHIGNRKNLTSDERTALNYAYDLGVADRTQSHDLAGIGENGSAYSPLRATVMRKLGWAFHQVERMNREVTYIAAYRMSRDKGMTPQQAMENAADLTWKVHFNYDNSNRPRVMQADAAKVFLMFRNYQVNMLWRLFRDAHQVFNGASKEERAEALKQLGGISGMMALSTGVRGVWLYGIAIAIANLMFGEDAEDKMKKGLIDSVGKTGAGMIMNGLGGHLTGIDLSGRIGMPDLWFRSPDKNVEGKDAYTYLLEQLFGPLGGIASNAFVGAQMAGEGNVYRGLETASPTAIKSALRAYRYGTEGVNTLKDEPIVQDISYADIIKQAIGFTPIKVAEQYRTNRVMKNKEQEITDAREGLLNRYNLAMKRDDDKEADKVLADIEKYNDKHPEWPILPKNVRASYRSFMQTLNRSEGGIILNKKLDGTIREGVAQSIYKDEE